MFRSIVLAGIVSSTLLAGCATVGQEPAKPDYKKSLYDGRSEVTFGTQLPIASPEEGEQRGDEALAQGDQDRALFEYIRALDMDDKNPGLLYKIGQIHARRDSTVPAETAFRWALALDDAHAGAHQALGLILLNKREYEEAKRHLSRATELENRLWRAGNALGVIADLDGDYRKAAAHYQAALVIQPRSALLLNNLGYSKYLAGDWDAALEALSRALSHDPNFDRAWRNLGLLYARRAQYQQALEAFERVMDPAAAYNNLGYICMGDGKYDMAQNYFRQAIRTSPTYYVAAHQNLAKTKRLLAQRTESAGKCRDCENAR